WEGIMGRLGFSTGLGVALLVAACSGDDPPGAPGAQSGLDIDGLDRTADPCVDFYQYACGGWVENHPLTADASDLNRFQDPFYDAVPDLANIVLGDARAPFVTDPNAALIGNYYTSCLAAPSSTAGRERLKQIVLGVNATTLADLARNS